MFKYLTPWHGTEREVVPQICDGFVFNDSNAEEKIFVNVGNWIGAENTGVNNSGVRIFKGEHRVKIDT